MRKTSETFTLERSEFLGFLTISKEYVYGTSL